MRNKRLMIIELAVLLTFALGSIGAAGAMEPTSPERLGPSSRRTGLVVSEIMYHPSPSSAGADLEYVELFNTQPHAENLAGWRFSGAIHYVFPTNTILPSQGCLVVARTPGDVMTHYDITNVVGGYTNHLKNAGESLRLHNRAGAVMLEIKHSNKTPWPVAADGAGHSLTLTCPSYGEADPRAWGISDYKGGSPGQVVAQTTNAFRGVCINEILANTDLPALDFVELYNHSAESVDLSGCWLSDSPSTNKFAIPQGTLLPPGGGVSFTETQMGFALKSSGETVFLVTPDDSSVIDAVRFEAQAKGHSCGRHPNGNAMLYPLNHPTPGKSNATRQASDVVINEIMYHPLSNDDADEYIELYNRSDSAINLSGWGFVDGVDYRFPTGTVLPADGYLVVARDAAHLRARYTNVPPTSIVGNYGGTLSNKGERVALARPESMVSTNSQGVATTNLAMVVVDEVTYCEGGRWGQWADGGGSSLELKDAASNHRLASNWADSDETAKSEWTLVEATGLLDNGTGSPNSLQILMQDAGEVLVDKIEVLNASGQNLVTNPTLESGVGGWVGQGNHSAISQETSEGYQSQKSLHIRALGRGDTGANRVRTTLQSTMTANTMATIRARVRWLKGGNEILFRLWGNYLEAFGTLATPQLPGTPGAPNSQRVDNAGPALFHVAHTPVLPTAQQAVKVTVHVQDHYGIGQVRLVYRIDPGVTPNTLIMKDDGTDGDLAPGDGIYTATIPKQASGVMVAFHIEATDAAPTPVTTFFPTDAPTRECLVRFGESQPAGVMGTYRLWMTQATFNKWASASKMDNTLRDVTFVYDNDRVIYNSGAMFAGSPHISPGYSTPSGVLCGYTLEFPADDMFLGEGTGVLDWPGRDNTAVQEPLSYWIAKELNLHYNYRRFIHLHVNGVTEQSRGSVYEDTQQPGRAVIDSWWPEDNDGSLHKIEQWFEFADAATSPASVIAPTLQKYTTTGGVKKTARYRWNWLPRAAQSMNDFTDFFTLVDAANATSTDDFTRGLNAVADMEQWMGIFAVEHLVVNFDSYGYDIGKNMYAYKPPHGRWQMMMFDIDWVMLASASAGYSATSSLFSSKEDSIVPKFYANPEFLRAYWRAIRNAVNGPLLPSNYTPYMDSLYAYLQTNGVTRSAGGTLTAPTSVKSWLANRRAYCVQQLATVNTSFAILSNGGTDFSTNRNLAILEGSAPIEVHSLLVNGIKYPVKWTAVTRWQLRVPLQTGSNRLTITGVDAQGQPVGQTQASITITCTAPAIELTNQVIFSEIMYQPIPAGAGFIELFNTSATHAFNLSGLRVNGIDFTFPPEACIAPNEYLVLTEDGSSFANKYGPAIPVGGIYAGQLDRGGETLTLVKDGANTTHSTIVDQVKFDDDAPWPSPADAPDASLQLIDSATDNSRVANWAMVSTNHVPTNNPPAWKRVVATGTATASTLYVYLTSPGDVYIDDLMLVAGATADDGTNFIKNGDFEAPLANSWTVSANHSGSTLSTSIKHSGQASLHLVASSGGSTKDSSVWQTTYTMENNAACTLSFWYLPTTNASELRIRLSGYGVDATVNVQPEQNPAQTTRYTPGAANSTTNSLANLPSLWINEVLPWNLAGITNGLGLRGGWIELYNSGSLPVSLADCYLSDSLATLDRWPLPAHATLAAGERLLVWADGLDRSEGELHASFTLSHPAGSVALSWNDGSQLRVLDYVNYTIPAADWSVAAYPEGQCIERTTMRSPTPGTMNEPSTIVVPVFINEWMAANSTALADPADGLCQDWFELYNAGSQTVDLTGFHLTDDPTVTNKFTIPSGYRIEPGAFLLVWADEETEQNQATNVDLHVNFRLSQSGEAITLFTPEGIRVDQIEFGPQTNDISQGRWPDGHAAPLFFMSQPTPRAANQLGSSPVPLQMTLMRLNSTTLAISWNAMAGVQYRLTYKNRLDDTAWQTVSTITATENQCSTNVVIEPVEERYFRVEVEP